MAHATPPDTVTYRTAHSADALVLGVLATQVFLDTYAPAGIRATVAREVLHTFSSRAFEHALADPAVHIEMADLQQHAVGFVHTVLGATQALVAAQAPGAVQAEVLRLYVQEPLTRRGIGLTLLQAGEAAVRRQGATVVWLTSWVHNPRALRFYASQGYQDVGATLFQFEGETHENRVLFKPLAP